MTDGLMFHVKPDPPKNTRYRTGSSWGTFLVMLVAETIALVVLMTILTTERSQKMNNCIMGYELQVIAEQVIAMPDNAVMRSVDTILNAGEEQVCLFAEGDQEMRTRDRKIDMFPTGSVVPVGLAFIGTVFVDWGEKSGVFYHVYEVPGE